jgi:hypothetical protein
VGTDTDKDTDTDMDTGTEIDTDMELQRNKPYSAVRITYDK